MDFLISDGSERFSAKVGRFGSEFGSVQNPAKPRFGSENIKNIVLHFRKPIYKYKLVISPRDINSYIQKNHQTHLSDCVKLTTNLSKAGMFLYLPNYNIE